MDVSRYGLELLNKNPFDIYEYAETVMRLVNEVDKRPIPVEINRIKNQYHIDHYYVLKKGKRIGVVKIFQGNYFYLGLEDSVEESEYPAILKMIENNLGGWRITRVEATLHDIFYNAFTQLGYHVDFSRIKMILKLEDAKNLIEDEKKLIRTYKSGDITHIIDMASDAYRGSVDENVGVFSGGMASSAISSILKGNYGEFRPDMTPLIVAEGSSYIEATCMTTISEGNPFVVLIGVRRAEQGKGYGRLLLSWVIKVAKELGYDELRLWVTVGNNAALNLYQSVGFQQVTKIHSIYRSL